MEKDVEEKEKGRRGGGTSRKRWRGGWRAGDGAPLYVQLVEWGLERRRRCATLRAACEVGAGEQATVRHFTCTLYRTLTYDCQFVVFGRFREDGSLRWHFARVRTGSFEVHVPEQNLPLAALIPLQHKTNKPERKGKPSHEVPETSLINTAFLFGTLRDERVYLYMPLVLTSSQVTFTQSAYPVILLPEMTMACDDVTQAWQIRIKWYTGRQHSLFWKAKLNWLQSHLRWLCCLTTIMGN